MGSGGVKPSQVYFVSVRRGKGENEGTSGIQAKNQRFAATQ